MQANVTTPANTNQAVIQRPQQNSLLLSFPLEVLIEIFKKMNPSELRRIRATCLAFNNAAGEVLCEYLKNDYQLIQELSPKIAELQPQEGSLGGRKIVVSPTPPQMQKKTQQAQVLSNKMTSFKLYLAYLKQHARPHHKNKE